MALNIDVLPEVLLSGVCCLMSAVCSHCLALCCLLFAVCCLLPAVVCSLLLFNTYSLVTTVSVTVVCGSPPGASEVKLCGRCVKTIE
jgi:hypothetical protein